MSLAIKAFVAAVTASLLLAGCEGALPKKEEEPKPVEDRSGATPGTGPGTADTGAPGTTRPMPATGSFQGHPLDDPQSILFKRVVYFDFDSAEIPPEDRPTIEAHAQFLAENPAATMVLEGHTDERGSREYNVGLGERRADAVRRLLILLGASDGQLRTVSYGEERPADLGHGEDAWAMNRRVELDYQTR